jgi:hypothetical protein
MTRIKCTLHEDICAFLIISRSVLLRMINFSDKICRENKKKHILCSETFFFRKSCGLWDNVGKYCGAGQATDDNMTHAYYMLDTSGCRHTLRICNSYCFSTTTMVARTRLIVTLHVHFLFNNTVCWNSSLRIYCSCFFQGNIWGWSGSVCPLGLSGGAQHGAIKWESLLWLSREIGRSERGQHFT